MINRVGMVMSRAEEDLKENGNEKSATSNIELEDRVALSNDDAPQLTGLDDKAGLEMAQDPDQEPPSEGPIENVVPDEEYSVLTTGQKKAVVLTVSLASLFSPMATAIYCKPNSILDPL